MDDIDDPYAVEPMIDLCNEYVNYLMEIEKNKIAVVDEVKDVCKNIKVIFETFLIYFSYI